jgi:hypothetical protein
MLWAHCDVRSCPFHLPIPLLTWHHPSVVVVVAVCIPRVPSFALNNATPLGNATGDWKTAVPTQFSSSPANFSFPAFAELQVDTDSNYLPLNFKHLRAQIFDLDSGYLIGSGDLGHKILPAKSFPDIQIPINFTYIATNDSDTTCTSPPSFRCVPCPHPLV